MERFFRSLKSEWVPRNGYTSLSQAKANIIDYIVGYYSQVRPHQHNNGLVPNSTENMHRNIYNSVKRHSHTGGVSPAKFEEDYFSSLESV